MRAESWTAIAGLTLVVAGCTEQSDDPLSVVSPPSELHTGLPDITGAVLGPDGASICDFVPEGTTITVRAIEVASQAFGGSADVICPDRPTTYRWRQARISFGPSSGTPTVSASFRGVR